MPTKKLFATMVWTQGTYMFLTAVWALADINSFMVVSGPKTDIWLVKTVAVVLLPIAICLFSTLFLNAHPLPAILTALAASIGLSFIDFYYTGNHAIKWVYIIDGVLQTIFAIGWGYLLVQLQKNK